MEGQDSSGEDSRTPPPLTEELAKEAEALFRGGRFAECVEVLNRLVAKKAGDPKVLHNIFVAEYFCEGCSDPRGLLDRLEKFKRTTEELACTSGERVEDNVGTNATSGSKGSGTTLYQSSASETGCIAYADKFDTSIITLNTAILLYQLHEYEHALSILEPLYHKIARIHETITLHVCLLILDIALASSDASKAAHVIQYLEKSFGVGYRMNQIDNGSNSQHQSSNQVTKASTTSIISAPDASSSDSNASANIIDNSLSGTLSDDALEYENLYSTLDGGGPNLGRPSSNDIAKAIADRGAVTELKLKVHLYKIRLLLLTRNFKAGKHEIKLAMNMARGRDSSSELLLKSQLEYARGNYRKADKLLTTNSKMTETPMLSIFNNNLGCIYYHLKGPHTSGIFFSKALRNSLSLKSDKSLKLSTFSQDKSFHIIYNCGIQNLSCGNPFVAAKCFRKASKIFSNHPVLWLRLAECCFLEQEKKGSLRSTSEEVKVHVVGSGRWRQLVVEDSKPKDGYSTGENSDQFKLSLPFAGRCLRNALMLLQKDDQNATKLVASSAIVEEDHNQGKLVKGSIQKNTSAGGSKETNTAPPSVPVNSNGDSKESRAAMSSNYTLQSAIATYEDTLKEEKHMIKQTVLGALAYVELSVEDYAIALSYAKSLIDLPECSNFFLFLGHVYAAEALCHLNRLEEAADHLLIYLSDVNRVELPYSNEDRDKWSIKKGGGDGGVLISSSMPKTADDSRRVLLTPEEARGATYVNLSTMFALQGDLERACRFVAEARSLLPKDSRALLADVYLDLLHGKQKEALSKLKQFSRVCYL